MILAGDIGGTKTLLALYDVTGTQRIYHQRYASASHTQFDQLLQNFLDAAAKNHHIQLTAAAFGIAGPIQGGAGAQRVHATNLPWQLDSTALSRHLGGVPVTFANDLVASGTAAIASTPLHRITLNHWAEPMVRASAGHVAVIAAGTGLGEAVFCFDGQRYHPMPTEGGHCSFAPNSAVEDQLWSYLRARLDGHISYERILSGKGFFYLYEFARAEGLAEETPHMVARLAEADDPSVVITQQACAGSDALSEIACRLFARIYGAEAGNLALKSLPFGGVFVAGAIASHILPFMQTEFMPGFVDKGRFADLLRQIPVWMVSDPDLALQGAARLAADQLSA
ncbi:MAG TPA: glucokinase [Halothiobacillus sp.]|nr:glucokinase [Halothiobacillus sp.]